MFCIAMKAEADAEPKSERKTKNELGSPLIPFNDGSSIIPQPV